MVSLNKYILIFVSMYTIVDNKKVHLFERFAEMNNSSLIFMKH